MAHGVVLVVQHLEHVGDVAVLVLLGWLGVRGVVRCPGVVRVGRGGRHEAGLALLAAAPHGRRAVALVVVGVRPPDIELSEQRLSVPVRQPLLEVILGEVDRGLAVHVPQVKVEQRHRDVELLDRQEQPRSQVVAAPLRRIW